MKDCPETSGNRTKRFPAGFGYVSSKQAHCTYKPKSLVIIPLLWHFFQLKMPVILGIQRVLNSLVLSGLFYRNQLQTCRKPLRPVSVGFLTILPWQTTRYVTLSTVICRSNWGISFLRSKIIQEFSVTNVFPIVSLGTLHSLQRSGKLFLSGGGKHRTPIGGG